MSDKDPAARPAATQDEQQQERTAAEPAERPDGDDVAEEVTAAFEQEIAEARRKADENWDRFLRAEAELSNQRKAAERARKEALARQRREILGRFLEVADNLERASSFQDADREALLEGLAGIQREVARILAREGLERLADEDEAFDPNRHEAVAVVPMPGLAAEKVIQVERPGYNLDGELLRPARVIVGQPVDGGA